jgi:hypothetical protein
VLWSPDNQNHTLNDLTARTYQTIRVVPTTLSAHGHSATFPTHTITPAGGQHTFTPEDAPILVEPVPPVPFDLRAELDAAGAPVLVWSREIGEVITAVVATTRALTEIPAEIHRRLRHRTESAHFAALFQRFCSLIALKFAGLSAL